MGSYGDEVKSLTALIGIHGELMSVIAMLEQSRDSIRVYVPPGTYSLDLRSEIVLPPSLEIWFARGARFVFREGLTLRIRGRVIADPTMIFVLPEVVDLSIAPGRARIVLEGEEQEEVRPEWFGAVPVLRGDLVGASPLWRKNARALQACLHAACRDRVRDGAALPPLTVVVRDPLHFDETLDVLPPEGHRGVLWMRGEDTATRSGTGIAALQRFARGGAGEVDGESSAALRIHPAVSVECSGVAIKVAVLDDAQGPHPTRDVGCAIAITESAVTPRQRHVFVDAAGLVGGRDAVVAIIDRERTRPPADGGGKSRATRYGFRDCTFDLRSGSRSSARTALRLDLTQDAMVTVTGGVIFQSAAAPQTRIDNEAGVFVRGASVLFRAVSMHLSEGPRPSRADSGTARAQPDGQDFWIDSGEGEIGSHLSVVHVDSQSWWLLGARPVLDQRAVGAVSLLNVGAGNINWGDPRMEPVRPPKAVSDPVQQRTITDPPTIAWPGGELPLLIEACSFRRYVTMEPGAQGRAADVGTVFSLPVEATDEAWWLSPAAIPSPAHRAVPVRDAPAGGRPDALTNMWPRGR